MLDALVEAKGIVTSACAVVGIARKTHYEWYNEDDVYKEQVDDIQDIALDFAENRLYELIEKGDTTATIFYLKTRGKRRGYIEKTEVQQSGSLTNINVTVDSGETADELRKLINSK